MTPRFSPRFALCLALVLAASLRYLGPSHLKVAQLGAARPDGAAPAVDLQAAVDAEPGQGPQEEARHVLAAPKRDPPAAGSKEDPAGGKGPWLFGRLVEASSGEPIGGAQIEAFQHGPLFTTPEIELWARKPIETDVDGLFEVELSRWGGWTGRATKSGFTATGFALGALGSTREFPFVFPMRRAGRVSFQVIGGDPEGVELTGGCSGEALVDLGAGTFREVLPSVQLVAERTESGFRIDDVPTRIPVQGTWKTSSGREGFWSLEPALEPGEHRELRIDLGRPGSVEVLLVDAKQNPVEGVEVQIVQGWRLPVVWMPSSGLANPVRLGCSEADGRVVFEDLATGNYAAIPIRGSTEQLGLPLPFDLTPTSREVHLQIDLVEGQSISGQLVDSEGRGLDRVYVYASSAHDGGHAQSYNRGQFHLGPLLPGDYNLRFQVQPWTGVSAPEPLTVSAGSENLQVVFPPGFEVLVRVSDRSGTALKPRAASVSGKTLRAFPIVRGKEELLEIFGLGAGSHSLLVSSEDGRFGWLRQLHLDPLDLGRTVDVTVQPASQLLISDRRGLARAVQLEVFQDEAFAARGSLRPHGRVMLHVPPGELELRAFHLEGGSFEKATRQVFARVGETVEVDWAP